MFTYTICFTSIYIVIEEKSEIKLLRIEYRSGTVEYGKSCGKLVFRMYTYKFRNIQINLSIAVTCKDIPDEYYFTYRSLLTLTRNLLRPASKRYKTEFIDQYANVNIRGRLYKALNHFLITVL